MHVGLLDGAARADIRGELLALSQHEARRLTDAADDDFRHAAVILHAERLQAVDREGDLVVSLGVALVKRALGRRSVDDEILRRGLQRAEVLASAVVRRGGDDDRDGGIRRGRDREDVGEVLLHLLRLGLDGVGDEVEVAQPDDALAAEHGQGLDRLRELELEHARVVDPQDLRGDDLGFGIRARRLPGLVVAGTAVLIDEVFVLTSDDGEIAGHAPNLPPSPLVAILCHSQAPRPACEVAAVGG